eukprot:gene13746-18437_t
MLPLILLILAKLSLILSDSSKSHPNFGGSNHGHIQPKWLINKPSIFHVNSTVSNNHILDVSKDAQNVTLFKEFCDYQLSRTTGVTDGEIVDVIEHFFWGMRNGVAMELGALDGSSSTRSMTHGLEEVFGWKRILVEGDPSYRERMLRQCPNSFSANVAICEKHTTVHFLSTPYVGGIVEFMDIDFIKSYHPVLYNAMTPVGNISSIDWTLFVDRMKIVDCVPLSALIHKSHVKHINFFILDVEGGELQVLKSIDWNKVRFDVLCVETTQLLSNNNSAIISEYLEEKGYHNRTGQQGRNTWYMHNDFVPSARPGSDPLCFNGARKADNAHMRWKHRGKWPRFESCPSSI